MTNLQLWTLIGFLGLFSAEKEPGVVGILILIITWGVWMFL